MTVVGHPLGDKNVSITQGVVSKYTCVSYSAQATILLPAIHVSAAINGGAREGGQRRAEEETGRAAEVGRGGGAGVGAQATLAVR